MLRAAVAAGSVAVVKSPVHERESARDPTSACPSACASSPGGRRLPSALGDAALEVRRRMVWTIEHELPERRDSDAADLDALASAIRHCDLVPATRSWPTCSAAGAKHPLGTTSESADRSCADACFALGEQASDETGPAHLVLVQSARVSMACA